MHLNRACAVLTLQAAHGSSAAADGVLLQIPIRDHKGTQRMFRLLRHDAAVPHDAVRVFCTAHDFRPLEACVTPLTKVVHEYLDRHASAAQSGPYQPVSSSFAAPQELLLPEAGPVRAAATYEDGWRGNPGPGVFGSHAVVVRTSPVDADLQPPPIAEMLHAHQTKGGTVRSFCFAPDMLAGSAYKQPARPADVGNCVRYSTAYSYS